VRQAARVSSINALKDVKRALAGFALLATNALGEANADVQRTTSWVRQDQLAYWRNAKRRRTAQLAQAKSELFRAEVASPDQRVPATMERKAVDKAQRLLEEAETKINNVKRWSRLLDREVPLYRGHCQQLGRAVEGELPQALVKLENMINTLEKYVAIQTPKIERPPPVGEEADA
jgi:hypothetical protein